jgi:hypothetical protein
MTLGAMAVSTTVNKMRHSALWQSFVILSVILLYVRMQNVSNNTFMLSVIMLDVIMLCVIMLDVIMLDVIMLNVIMLSVVSPLRYLTLFVEILYLITNIRPEKCAATKTLAYFAAGTEKKKKIFVTLTPVV